MNESEIKSYEEYLKDELTKTRKERDGFRLERQLSQWHIEDLEQQVKDYEAKIALGQGIPHYVSRMQSKMARQGNDIKAMQATITRQKDELKRLLDKSSKQENIDAVTFDESKEINKIFDGLEAQLYRRIDHYQKADAPAIMPGMKDELGIKK